MRLLIAPPILAVALAALLGCSEPKMTFGNVRTGMAEAQVVAILGKPTTTGQQGNVRWLEYETFDQDRWFGVGRKENVQFFTVRLVDGRVESAGKKGELGPIKTPVGSLAATQKANIDKREETVGANPAATASFDLRTELEKLEKLKKDGLITESEFKELRQRLLEKFKAQ